MSIISSRASSVVSLLVTLTIVLTVILTWFKQLPADDQQFSIGKAIFSNSNTKDHLTKIAKSSHYTGSQTHSDVKHYITNQLKQLGLEVEIQSELATSSKYFVASKVQNIVAKLPSTARIPNKFGLALMSHYDSANYTSSGASDAGHGVAIIIEAMRTLIESEEPRQNDIYVIITDAEEQGLLGAEAFVDSHRWADKIGLTLNFEARGSGGVSYTLLETNTGNKALIDAFSQAHIGYPVANSLMYSIYKMLPNDTDLTVLRERGNIKGFNFAFIDDHFDYHTQQDTVDRLDDNTLNHQINYLTALLPYFANFKLTTLDSQSDHVYFNVGTLGMLSYPFDWVLPMAVLAVLMFIVMGYHGIKRGKLTFKHMLISFIPVLLSVGIALLVGAGGWAALVWLFPQFTDIPQGFTYSGHYVIATGILLSMSLSSWLYSWITARYPAISTASWYVAVLVVWLTLNIGISLYLTGAGFFIVVVIACLGIFALLLRTTLSASASACLIALLSIPPLVIITPQIPVFVIGLGLSSLSIATILSVLMLMMLLPLLFMLKGIRSIQLFMFAGALISFIGIVQHADYSSDRKKPSSVNYLYDTQTKQAYLFSFNQRTDEFNQQFFSVKDRGNQALQGIYPISSGRYPQFVKAITSLELLPSSYVVERTSSEDKMHKVNLTVTPNRDLTTLQISSHTPILIHSMSINGKAFSTQQSRPKSGFVMRYVVTDSEPVQIQFDYTGEQPAQLRLLEANHDFANLWPTFVKRPEHIMPTPFRPSDLTIISQPILFE